MQHLHAIMKPARVQVTNRTVGLPSVEVHVTAGELTQSAWTGRPSEGKYARVSVKFTPATPSYRSPWKFTIQS